MKGAVGMVSGADQFWSTNFFQFWSQVLNNFLLSQEGAVGSKQAYSVRGDSLSEAGTQHSDSHSIGSLKIDPFVKKRKK